MTRLNDCKKETVQLEADLTSTVVAALCFSKLPNKYRLLVRNTKRNYTSVAEELEIVTSNRTEMDGDLSRMKEKLKERIKGKKAKDIELALLKKSTTEDMVALRNDSKELVTEILGSCDKLNIRTSNYRLPDVESLLPKAHLRRIESGGGYVAFGMELRICTPASIGSTKQEQPEFLTCTLLELAIMLYNAITPPDILIAVQNGMQTSLRGAYHLRTCIIEKLSQESRNIRCIELQIIAQGVKGFLEKAKQRKVESISPDCALFIVAVLQLHGYTAGVYCREEGDLFTSIAISLKDYLRHCEYINQF